MRSRRPHIATFTATGAYVGYLPIAPGTWGSALGWVLDLPLRALDAPVWHGLIVFLVVVAGVWSASVVEKTKAQKDPSIVVVDEIAGMLISLFALPMGWRARVAAFFVFRALDIVKPFPCRQAERLPGGWGIVADDVVAGIYTNVIMRAVVLVISFLGVAPQP